MGNRFMMVSFGFVVMVLSSTLSASLKRSKGGFQGLPEVSENSGYISSSSEESDDDPLVIPVKNAPKNRSEELIHPKPIRPIPILDLSRCSSYDKDDETLPPATDRQSNRSGWVKANEGLQFKNHK